MNLLSVESLGVRHPRLVAGAVRLADLPSRLAAMLAILTVSGLAKAKPTLGSKQPREKRKAIIQLTPNRVLVIDRDLQWIVVGFFAFPPGSVKL